jgi:hypothetical protein
VFLLQNVELNSQSLLESQKGEPRKTEPYKTAQPPKKKIKTSNKNGFYVPSNHIFFSIIDHT